MKMFIGILSLLVISHAKAGTYVNSHQCSATLFEVTETAIHPFGFSTATRIEPNYGMSFDRHVDSEGNKYTIAIYNGHLGRRGLQGRISVEKNGVKIWDTGDLPGDFVKSQDFKDAMISFGCQSRSVFF